MKRRLASVPLAVLLFLPSCWTLTHTVGTGASAHPEEVGSARQWSILFGLVPLNRVDSGTLPGVAGSPNYTITAEQSFFDVCVNLLTSLVTIHSRTVTVTR
jgi:hypothetical protein